MEKNNVTMQIWLGKNVLNQTDAPLDEEAELYYRGQTN